MVGAGITKGRISSGGSVPTDLRGCSVEVFFSPYLLVYYSNLKLQGPITLKGVMQPLYGSLVAGRGKVAAIDL